MSRVIGPGPYTRGAAITPHDTNPNVFSAIYVGGAGNVTIEPLNSPGVFITFTAPPVGSWIEVKCTRVRATGTTATLLIGVSE